MTTILVLDELRKRFGAVTAVDGVNLEIHRGELVCLLGPSGCGKTTTLRLIAGFERPSDGRISLDERVISSARTVLPPEGREMAMMFQSYAVWPHMTVYQNVSYGLRARRVGKAHIRQRVMEALEVVRMGAYADRYPGELSGGQQQRVSFARAFVVDPAILLMDEPLSNLDSKLRVEMRSELRRLHEQLRFTGVYVTHDQAEAMTLADRIAVMNQGRIEQIGTPEELYKRPANRYVATFLGGANIVPGVMESWESIRLGNAVMPCDSAGPYRPGQAVVAVIRPRSIELDAQGSLTGAGCIECTVESAAYLGGVAECRLRAHQLDAVLVAFLRTPDSVRPGDRIRCRIGDVLALEGTLPDDVKPYRVAEAGAPQGLASDSRADARRASGGARGVVAGKRGPSRSEA